MKDMLNVMGKFLAMGMSLDDVILRSTWNPAWEIQLEQLGNLSVGSPGDVAVLRLEKGKFAFTDPSGGRMDSSQRIGCEMTVRNGKVVYDQNGITGWPGIPWETGAPWIHAGPVSGGSRGSRTAPAPCPWPCALCPAPCALLVKSPHA